MSKSEESDKSLRTKIQELEREMNLLPKAEGQELEKVLENTRLVFDQTKSMFHLLKESGDQLFVHDKCIKGQFEIISDMSEHLKNLQEQLDGVIEVSKDLNDLHEEEIATIEKKYSIILKIGICFQIITILAISFK